MLKVQARPSHPSREEGKKRMHTPAALRLRSRCRGDLWRRSTQNRVYCPLPRKNNGEADTSPASRVQLTSCGKTFLGSASDEQATSCSEAFSQDAAAKEHREATLRRGSGWRPSSSVCARKEVEGQCASCTRALAGVGSRIGGGPAVLAMSSVHQN